MVKKRARKVTSLSLAKKKIPIKNKIQRIEGEEERIETEEKRIENQEKKVIQKLNKLDKEEGDIEKTLIKFAGINIKKRHLYEVLRASAGAFLGVGLGRALLGLDTLAVSLPWINVMGILLFILLISSLLIYKNEKENVKKTGIRVVFQRLVVIYFISLVIEFLSLILFQVQYSSVFVLIKIMIVGSYTAMASAVSFSLDK